MLDLSDIALLYPSNSPGEIDALVKGQGWEAVIDETYDLASQDDSTPVFGLLVNNDLPHPALLSSWPSRISPSIATILISHGVLRDIMYQRRGESRYFKFTLSFTRLH